MADVRLDTMDLRRKSKQIVPVFSGNTLLEVPLELPKRPIPDLANALPRDTQVSPDLNQRSSLITIQPEICSDNLAFTRVQTAHY